MQLKKHVKTSVKTCAVIPLNQKRLLSVDYALVEHCSPDIIGLWVKSWKAKLGASRAPIFCIELFP